MGSERFSKYVARYGNPQLSVFLCRVYARVRCFIIKGNNYRGVRTCGAYLLHGVVWCGLSKVFHAEVCLSRHFIGPRTNFLSRNMFLIVEAVRVPRSCLQVGWGRRHWCCAMCKTRSAIPNLQRFRRPTSQRE